MNDKYLKIKELSQEAYNFCLKLKSEEIADGRHDLTDDVFANVMTYETKLRKDCCFEAHKKYIDVQIILDGCENIATEHIDVMHRYKCLQPFADGDTELFEMNDDGKDNILNKGDFIILFPEDAHMPCVCVNTPSPVRKAVIKIPAKQ